MAADLVLYGVKGSPFVRKVQVALAEKALDYELKAVSIFPAPEWFAEISPAKRIPVLRDRRIGEEGRVGTLPDSSVICTYLERLQPSPALYPKDPFAHARALWFEEYADSELSPLIGLGMFRPAVVAPLTGQPADLDTARATLHEKLPPLFDYLHSELAPDQRYLVADQFSIADISIACQMINLHLAGGSVDASRWPHLAAYVERILTRDSLAACLAEERKLFKPVDLD